MNDYDYYDDDDDDRYTNERKKKQRTREWTETEVRKDSDDKVNYQRFFFSNFWF